MAQYPPYVGPLPLFSHQQRRTSTEQVVPTENKIPPFFPQPEQTSTRSVTYRPEPPRDSEYMGFSAREEEKYT